MIDPKLFTVDSLLSVLLDDVSGNVNAWRKHAEILPAFVADHALPGTPTKCVVRVGKSFLRYSKGPGQGHFWDCYGDDYLNPERALVALLEAPVPPWLVDYSRIGAYS